MFFLSYSITYRFTPYKSFPLHCSKVLQSQTDDCRVLPWVQSLETVLPHTSTEWITDSKNKKKCCFSFRCSVYATHSISSWHRFPSSDACCSLPLGRVYFMNRAKRIELFGITVEYSSSVLLKKKRSNLIKIWRLLLIKNQYDSCLWV